MLKRFYSKKSGFTLVEIIIAFAVFAIMASMICQILQLSVAARRSNNIYQQELAKQEALLTLVEKQNGDFKSEAGKIKLNFGSSSVEIPYAMVSANPDLSGDDMYSGEGLNYFVANVNYGASGEIPIGDPEGEGEGEGDADSNTGSQASRMDTRITGTGGIGYIKIWSVIKDEHEYKGDNPNEIPVPEGHTRYYFAVSASEQAFGKSDVTLQAEDIPYSQYRLYFYDDVVLNAAESKLPRTEGKVKYRKDVYQALKISDVGYLSTKDVEKVAAEGLNSSYIQDSYSLNGVNKYTIEQMGNSCIRIGSPFTTSAGDKSGMGGRGRKFELGEKSVFYVDFENIEVSVKKPDGTEKIEKVGVTLSTASFGHNGVDAGDGVYNYAACPQYKAEYDSGGNPIYPDEEELKKMKRYVNIYGANLFTRHYGEGGDS